MQRSIPATSIASRMVKNHILQDVTLLRRTQRI